MKTQSHSIRSKARSSWSKVEILFPITAPTPCPPCSICGGKVEESPLMRDVCYSCYRAIVEGEITDPRKTSDPRIARRESILAAFAETPLSKSEAHELYSELAEIDQALQFNPSDTCQAYISAALIQMEEIPF